VDYVARVMNRRTVYSALIFTASLAFFALYLLHNIWPETIGGHIDGDTYYAAGRAVIEGAMDHIYEIGAIRPGPECENWANAPLYQQYPGIFRDMVRLPGYVVPYIYPPPWAGIFAVPALLGKEWFHLIWIMVLIGSWIAVIFAGIRSWHWKLIAVAILLWFPPFHGSLISGNITPLLIALVFLGGPFGVAVAGWAKPWIWIGTIAMLGKRQIDKDRRWYFLFGFVIMAWLGMTIVGRDLSLFFAWIKPLHLMSNAIGGIELHDIWRMSIGAIIALVAIFRLRGRHRLPLLMFGGQLLSPVWWDHYWCWLIPALLSFRVEVKE